jgi:alanine-glyoxylate transaminase/serine-glyoxylate transaminase/serine-pyruvate transaminase
MKYTLMIPGPVEVPEEILEAFSGQPVAHYGHQWSKLYLETAAGVSNIIACNGRTFLMPGSGSLGLDTVASTFCREKKCLVLNNGMFGQRLYEIVSRYTAEVEFLNFPLGIAADPEQVKKALGVKSFDVILFTHVETSTGILNPVFEIANVAKKYGAMVILDAVSSAGIEELKTDVWGIDAVVTASQKGFECPAGLGIVTVKKNLIPYIPKINAKTWYTDLGVWCDYYERWHDWHPFPVTLPTNVILALSKSIEAFKKEGVKNRNEMYKDVTKRLRKALGALGLKLFSPDAQAAHGLTAASTNGKFDPSRLVDYLKEIFGIQITGSFGSIKSEVFRIGHMSRKQCRMENLVTLINGVALFMKSCGQSVSMDEAVSILLET